MKRTLSTTVALAMAAGLWAQGALDLQSRMQLHQQRMAPAVKERVLKLRGQHPQSTPTDISYGFVEVKTEADIKAFQEAGGQVLSRRGNILLTAMPTNAVESIAQTPGVARVQLSRPLHAKLNRARKAVGVDKIHGGIELPRAYTGRGVVAGIVDGGMDPNHINFKDADGNPRIKHFTYIRPNQAGTDMLASFYTPEQLPSFKTDDALNYHGTHTMGIMAGGYRGKVRTANDMGVLSTVDNPYYGMAPDAEIAASCGQLNDMFIAYGIDYICEYAYNQRKPVVVNLSLGSNLGTHDGNNVMSRYLDAVSEQDNVTFCVAAGNEGDMNIALNKTFTAQDTVVKTFIRPTAFGAENRYGRYGSVQIYSADSTAFNTQVVVYNKTRGRVAFRMAIEGNLQGGGRYYVSSQDYASSSNDVVSAELAKAFEGYVGLGSMTDPDTGRFYAIVSFLTFNNTTYNANNQYLLGIEVTGRNGQRMDMFSDGQYTDLSSMDVAGWTGGTPDGSISDMACTRNALIVGSYNTRDRWVSMDGNLYGFDTDLTPGTVSAFSSYGTLIDGRSLPNLCAPGATLISSCSGPFVYNPDNGIEPKYVQGESPAGAEAGYWMQMAGTSMATPVVAGAVALWLEADPTLKPAAIKEIAMQTAVRDADVTQASNPVKWGAGKFDAYAGLKEVLRRQAGVSNVSADAARTVVTADGDRAFRVLVPGASSVDAVLYNTCGAQVLRAASEGDEVRLECRGVAPGIYLLSANGHTQRIAIR